MDSRAAWQQCTSRGMARNFTSVSTPASEHSRHPSHLVMGLLNYISNMKGESAWLCYSSVCLDLWLVLCCRCLNHHMICRLLQILFPVLFHIAEVRTCWHWTSYYFYLPICTAYVNNFVASVCPFCLLFVKGFLSIISKAWYYWVCYFVICIRYMY